MYIYIYIYICIYIYRYVCVYTCIRLQLFGFTVVRLITF